MSFSKLGNNIPKICILLCQYFQLILYAFYNFYKNLRISRRILNFSNLKFLQKKNFRTKIDRLIHVIRIVILSFVNKS